MLFPKFSVGNSKRGMDVELDVMWEFHSLLAEKDRVKETVGPEMENGKGLSRFGRQSGESLFSAFNSVAALITKYIVCKRTIY